MSRTVACPFLTRPGNSDPIIFLCSVLRTGSVSAASGQGKWLMQGQEHWATGLPGAIREAACHRPTCLLQCPWVRFFPGALGAALPVLPNQGLFPLPSWFPGQGLWMPRAVCSVPSLSSPDTCCPKPFWIRLRVQGF